VADLIWRSVAGLLVLAILFVLVRPGSEAGQAVIDLTNIAKRLVSSAVG